MDNAHYTGAPACIGFAVRACLIGVFILCGFANALASQQVSAEAPVVNVSSNEVDPYAEENEIIAEIFNDITGGGPMTVNLTLLFDKVEVDGQKLKVMSFNITHIFEHKTMQIGTHKWPGGRRIITKDDF